MTDLRTPAEIAYDNLKNGSAYVKPQPLDDIQTLLDRARASDMSDATQCID